MKRGNWSRRWKLYREKLREREKPKQRRQRQRQRRHIGWKCGKEFSLCFHDKWIWIEMWRPIKDTYTEVSTSIKASTHYSRLLIHGKFFIPLYLTFIGVFGSNHTYGVHFSSNTHIHIRNRTEHNPTKCYTHPVNVMYLLSEAIKS